MKPEPENKKKEFFGFNSSIFVKLILVFLLLSIIPTLLSGFLLIRSYKEVIDRLLLLIDPSKLKEVIDLSVILNNIQVQSIMILLIASLLVIFFIINFARKFNQRIKRLIRGTEVISKGDLERQIEIDVHDEIGRLAHSFNNMIIELKKSRNRLEEEITRVNDLFIDTIHSLSAAVDAKDPYTRGHSERVANIARILASEYIREEKIKDGEELERRIYLSALLHDIGKIGIEDKILMKTTGLTLEEYEIIKKHPEIGVKIIGDIQELKNVVPGILQHHEKYDGSGYPGGIKGEEISIEGRIIAIADYYDAMTSNRPYREKTPPENILGEIKRLSGIHFDPVISSLFDRLYPFN